MPARSWTGLLATLLIAAFSLGASCRLREPLDRLAVPVVDAGYSQSLRLLVLATDAPPALRLYEPWTRAQREVALPSAPTCASVGSAGATAAVGHDGSVSLVDLVAGAVVASWAVPFEVSRVVLADEGVIHAFPDSGEVASIDPATGAVVRGWRDWGWDVRQQPGRPFVYAAVGSNGLRKFETEGGALVMRYGAPYWNPDEHPFCQRLWLSDDGRRIVTGCGHTFRASSSIDPDMRHVGSLSALDIVASVAHASAAGALLAIPAPYSLDDPLADIRVQLYHDATLAYRGAFPLPAFRSGAERFPAHGRFVFFDAGGRFFVLVVEADPTAGASGGFAVLTRPFSPALFQGGDSGPAPPDGPPPQTFATLAATVVDAEYDAGRERLVYVSADPSALRIVDPEGGAEQGIALPHPPSSLALAPDGARAVVGHDDGALTVVDLDAGVVSASHVLPRGALDTALVGEHAYALPRRSDDVMAVDLASGATATSFPYSVSTYARAALDATGTRLYVASNQVHPGGITLFDLSALAPRYLRGVGSAAVGGALWTSEDGARLLTRGGAVFRTSPIATQDVALEGRLEGATLLRHVGDSAEAATIAAIPGVPDPDGHGFAYLTGPWNGDPAADAVVQLFDAQSLALRATLPLPPFVVGGASHPAHGRFVFFNGAGTRLHVVVEADPASGLVDGFGLVTFELGSPPGAQARRRPPRARPTSPASTSRPVLGSGTALATRNPRL